MCAITITKLDMGLVMRMLLTFAAVSGATFLLSEPGLAQAGPAHCVEADHSTITAAAKRRAGRSECNAQATLENGFREAGHKAMNAIRNICLQKVTQNVANATCQSHGLSVETSQNVHFPLNNALPAVGAGPIDDVFPIGFNGVALMCAVLRKVPEETERDTQDDNVCLGHPRTIAFVRTRARCGVACN